MIITRNPDATLVRLTKELQAAKDAAALKVNALTNTARTKYVTDIAGQEMIYLRKEAEAVAWLADPAPIPADYPYLVAEIGVTAPTAYELAQLWLNMAYGLRIVGAQMEGARHTALFAIAAAQSPVEINDALAIFCAAIEGI